MSLVIMGTGRLAGVSAVAVVSGISGYQVSALGGSRDTR